MFFAWFAFASALFVLGYDCILHCLHRIFMLFHLSVSNLFQELYDTGNFPSAQFFLDLIQPNSYIALEKGCDAFLRCILTMVERVSAPMLAFRRENFFEE